MLKRIHIFGASGSGTTTLGKELSEKLNIAHFDTDDYFWEPTSPPFIVQRKKEERIKLLTEAIEKHDAWILSGSLCGWGDVFIPQFDLAVYLYIPKELRMKRLIKRERERYGKDIDEGGEMHEVYNEFMSWAESYDSGDISIRSKALHEKWMKDLSCRLLKLEGDIPIEEKVNEVIREIEKA